MLEQPKTVFDTGSNGIFWKWTTALSEKLMYINRYSEGEGDVFWFFANETKWKVIVWTLICAQYGTLYSSKNIR